MMTIVIVDKDDDDTNNKGAYFIYVLFITIYYKYTSLYNTLFYIKYQFVSRCGNACSEAIYMFVLCL